jgi:selenocysteine-specific elongation factor
MRGAVWGAPLKSGKRVRIHHGSGNFPARLMMKSSELRAGERALARLHFELPIFVFAGDRFIVRDWAGQRTVAGGMVLDPQAQQRNFRSSRTTRISRWLRGESWRGRLSPRHIARDGAFRRAGLLAQSRFSNAEIAQSIVQLEKQGAVVGAGDLVVDAAWWKRLSDTASEAIATWHTNHAEQIGMPLNKLRELVEKANGQCPYF